MRQRIVCRAIVLTRVNYQEADRIITLLTPQNGKVRVIAKGVRKSKSKMAGGVELFSINELQYLPGRGDISTLTSSRLIKHFANIGKNIDKTMFAYEALKQINHVSEDDPDELHFNLIEKLFTFLDTFDNLKLIELWFYMQLLNLLGKEPDIHTKLTGKTFNFNYEEMSFVPSNMGQFKQNHIKLMRIALRWTPERLSKLAISADDINITNNITKKIYQYN